MACISMVLLDAPVATAQPAAAAMFQLRRITGDEVEGRLISIKNQTVSMQVESRRVQYALDELESLQPTPDSNAVEQKAKPDLADWTFYLADGSELKGRLDESGAPSDGRMSPKRLLRVRLSSGPDIAVPVRFLAAIRFTPEPNPAGQPEFAAHLAQRESDRDYLIVDREGKRVSFSGAFEKLTASDWTFSVNGRPISGSTGQAYGIVCAGASGAASGDGTLIRLAGGDSLRADVQSADRQRLRLDAKSIGKFELPWSAVAAIEFQSGRIVYVSDLKPVDTVRRSMMGMEWDVARDANVTGGPLVLDRQTYAKGLGVHSYSAVSYDLAGGFERFMADAGIDDSTGGRGSVVFRVIGDGRTLFESPNIIGGHAPATVSVDVTGVRRLTLECDFGEAMELGDHGDWGGARLIRPRGARATMLLPLNEPPGLYLRQVVS